MPGVPRIAFVIPVLNDAARLRRCLASIAADPVPDGDHEVVVVDNGSIDDSALTAAQAGARVLSAPHVKVAEARNRGVAETRAPILAFVDADHEIMPGWTAAALDVLADPFIAAVGNVYHAPPEANWVQRLIDGLRGHDIVARDVDWLAGGNLAVRRDAFLQVGGFDPSLQTCEDVDLCQRLRASGHRLVADPRLVSYHHGDPKTLSELFRGECWRGGDNLRVSLRGPLSWRSLPSILGPIACLLCVGISFLALLMPRLDVALTALAFPLSWIAARSLRILAGLPDARFTDWPKALAVAAVYESARAVALIAATSTRHRRAS
jgi:hypothetical protein